VLQHRKGRAMPSDFEIGRIVGVDTAQVTIELNPDIKALTKATYEGAQEIGRINSYVIMPVGARRLVAMVTRVFLTEEAEIAPDRTMVTLPSASRRMKATLIGTIDGGSYTQGIAVFPVLDNPVHLVTSRDLQIIFDKKITNLDISGEKPDPDDPGFCIRLGDSPIFEGFSIQINPDGFFGKHAAILGSTGSGKSCTIASLIQSILSRPEIKQTHFIILDTNGEYRSAFQKQKNGNDWENVGNWSCLYIPSDQQERSQRLVVPYWFMNSDDFIRLFRAREGLQSPVLLRALRLSRSEEAGESAAGNVIEVMRTACNQIVAILQNDAPNQQWAIAKNIKEHCEDTLRYRQIYETYVKTLDEACGTGTYDVIEQAFRKIKEVVEEVTEKVAGKKDQALGATRQQQIRDAIDPVLKRLNEISVKAPCGVPGVSADQPIFFDRGKFLEKSLETAMKEQAESGSPGRIREACGPMFLRIRRFFEDPRFEFLFGQFPKAVHTLATFVRDAVGLPSRKNIEPALSNKESAPEKELPFYDRQRSGMAAHNVVIFDLSLLASEVLENVTALLGRVILEFLQRLGEYGSERARGSLPVILVLEEAQNYIREPKFGEEESISRVVFERIAREGRKYGLGLVIASQRPSELSKTVLSQCNSFIVHRLQNPEDLRYFKEIVPGIYGPLLDQLPALAPQTALVLGECVRAPALVRIREARPVPRSRDPKFYRYWVAEKPEEPNVEEICRIWEGGPEKK
jgi:hypothetical protein